MNEDTKAKAAWGILIGLAAVKIILHFWVNLHDNFFRDEFYYMACGRHLDFGYVDHPPFVAVMAALSHALWGDSVFTLRIFSTLAGAALIVLAGLLARELGGNRFAQGLAGLAVLACPSYLGIQGYFSMNAFDHLFWMLAAYTLVLGIRRNDPKIWLLFGVILGIGLQNKISVLFLGFGLTLGLLLSPSRKLFLNPWLWAAGGLAGLIFLPHILWQTAYDWPTREFIYNATTYKNMPMSPGEFIGAQLMENNFFLAPVWLAGLGWYLFAKKGRPYQAFGWMYLIVLVLFIAQRGKPYYLAPAYAILFAAGAVAIERGIERTGWNWLKPVVYTIAVLGALPALPFTNPILPPDTFLAYARAMGIEEKQAERHEKGVLPQFFADRYGWEEMAETVAGVYRQLPPEEQAKCVIAAGNYGEAGAIEHFGRKHNLPPVVCGHNSYFLWGPGEATGEVVIAIGSPKAELEKIFEEVSEAAVADHPLAMPYERNLKVFVCRRPKMSLQEFWPKAKHYS